MSFTIELTYFKQSGKYYASGSYSTHKQHMYEIKEEIEKLQLNKELPGVKHGQEFYIAVNANNHPNGYPILIHPLIDNKPLDNMNVNSKSEQEIASLTNKLEDSQKLITLTEQTITTMSLIINMQNEKLGKLDET